MSEDYLIHYGVKGMKWGVRKEYDSRSRNSVSKQTYKSNKRRQISDEERRNRRKKMLKRAAIVAGIALATYGAYKLGQSGKLDALVSRGMKASRLDGELFSGVLDSSSGFRKMSKPESVSESIKKVNPLRNTPQGTKNCTFCAVATFLRRKGYDVEALGANSGHSFADVVERSFKDAHVYSARTPKVSTADGMASIISKRFKGEDCDGAISIPFGGGRGHAFNWELRNGEVKFFDGQLGVDDVDKYFGHIDTTQIVDYVRLDNLEIKPDGVKQYVKGRS